MQNFQVYRTSAGAGKTYTIVKEFIKLSIQSPKAAANIAAITFTNKAANEMKDRVIEYLVGITSENPENGMIELANNIALETNKSIEEVIEHCKKTLKFLLHNYSKFAISTIDSFVHEILRVFSRDLKLPDNFNVEVDSELLIENIVNQVFANINNSESDYHSNNINKHLLKLTLENFNENEKWDITFMLKKTAKLLFSENSIESVKILSEIEIPEFAKFSTSINKALTQYQEETRNIANLAYNSIVNNGLNDTDFYQGRNGIASFFGKLRNYSLSNQISINSYHLKAINENIWVSKGKSDIPENLKTELINHFNNLTNLPLFGKHIILLKIKSTISTLALISYMQKIFNLYKHQNDIVHISEFNKTVSDVVKNESAPFIYERIGQIFSHFLLDEFQDTSIMQWHNMFPLVDNTLANSNKILVVGDVKQSIYKFRNSELNLLLSLPQIYPSEPDNIYLNDIEYLISQNFQDLSELESFNNINYRSDEQIVDFNNKHFEWISSEFNSDENSNPLITKAYQNSSQNIKASAKDKGYVNICLLNNENYKENQIEKIIEICESLRPNFKDIAILVRSNSNAQLIASGLMNKENPIPVISSESLSIDFSDKVKFVVNIIALLENNENQPAIIAAYTFLYKSSLLKSLESHSFDHWLLTNKNIPLFSKFINLLHENGYEFNVSELLNLNIYEISSRIILCFDLNSKFDNYLLFFQNAIFDFYRKNNSGLRQFLDWWQIKGAKLSVIMPEGANAVKILSVHKSKGLQFPTVIYPFADFNIKNSKNEIWIDTETLPDEIKNLNDFPKKLKKINLPLSLHSEIDKNSSLAKVLEDEKHKVEIDSINIHYVAMTRAKNKLFVISKKIDKEINCSSNIAELLNKHLIIRSSTENINCIEDENSANYYFGNNTKPNDEVVKDEQKECLNQYHIRKTKAAKIASRAIKNKYDLQFASEFGNMFHDFISIIETTKDIENQIEIFVKQTKIDQQNAVKLLNMTNLLLEHPIAGKFFNNKLISFNEATIIYGNENYRPDKIVFDENKVYVIDFKTGSKQNKYKSQIENYCNLIKQMGYKNVEACLIYINNEILEVEQIEL